METPNIINLQIENFRAIQTAEIIINGITLVTEENGYGKSILSKLVYYFFKTTTNYEILIAEKLYRELRKIRRFLETASTEALFNGELPYINNRNIRNKYLKKIASIFNRIDTKTSSEEHLKNSLVLVDQIHTISTIETKTITESKNNKIEYK